MLPFYYAVRNLLRDPSRLIQKVLGAAMVVFLVFAAGAFNHGMDRVLSATGSKQNIIFLGAGSEESLERSEIPVQAEAQISAGVRGIRNLLGSPAVSGEVHYMGMLTFPNGHQDQALLRGVTPNAFLVHQQVRLLEGRYPSSGEVLVGRLAHHTLNVPKNQLRPGATLLFEDQALTIAGVFMAPGTVMESEVWFDRNDLMTLAQRDSLSCVVARMESPDGYLDADLFASQRLDLELVALRETDYYQQLSAFYGPVRGMAWLTAILIAAGAVFGGLNMLYAAFASRIRELATLQAVGFTRPAILLSLLQESLLAALTGTLLATVLAIPLLGQIQINFSMGTFYLELLPSIALLGLVVGIVLGTLGALPPALRCLGAPLPIALRSS